MKIWYRFDNLFYLLYVPDKERKIEFLDFSIDDKKKKKENKFQMLILSFIPLRMNYSLIFLRFDIKAAVQDTVLSSFEWHDL